MLFYLIMVDCATFINFFTQPEHANALCKSYESKRDDLLTEALRKSFRMTSQLKKVDWKLNPGKKGAERSVDLKILVGNVKIIIIKHYISW